MADEPDYFEFLESVSDSISDILLFATQSNVGAIILAYEQIDIAMRSLIAVGEEVRDKIDKEELREVATKGVEDSVRTLDELNNLCLEVQGSGDFTNAMRRKMLETGKGMLLASVRVLKVADVFECLRVIKKLRLALETTDVLGNQVSHPSEFNEIANLASGDCDNACKGMRAREQIVQELEYREGLAQHTEIVQKLTEPFVRIVNKDVNNPGDAQTQALRQRTLAQITDSLNKGLEIVELSSVDLFADIETSFQLMGAGSYEHDETPEAERAAEQVEEAQLALAKLNKGLKAKDMSGLVDEVKKLAGAIKGMEDDMQTPAEKAKHKKLLATLTPLVKEVKAVLANPSEEQKAVVAEKIAEAAKANQEVYENLRGKLKKSRVEEMNKVMEPQIFSNQYMQADPQQILDPLQELKKESAAFNDLTKDAKLYANEQFRPDQLGDIGKSNDALMRAADGLEGQDPSSAISVVIDPKDTDAQVYANQGMAPDGSRLEDAMRELLNVADGLDPEDCREIAQGDQRIRKLIEEGKYDEAIPLIRDQLLACKSLSRKCKGGAAASLLEMANQLQDSLNDLGKGMQAAPVEKYKKADVKGLLDEVTKDSKLSPLAKEAQWFKIALEGEGKMDAQAKQVCDITDQIAGCLDVLTTSSDPQQMIQNGKNAAVLSAQLSKLAKSYGQNTKRGNAKELQAVADNLRNVSTQLKILSCICASSGADGNDPVKNCVATLQNTVKKSLAEIRVSCI